MLIGTLDREIFSDVILPKYGSIENRYLVFESRLINCLILYEILSTLRIYIFQIIVSLLNTSSNYAIASCRFLQMKDLKDLQKSVPIECFGKERSFTIRSSRPIFLHVWYFNPIFSITAMKARNSYLVTSCYLFQVDLCESCLFIIFSSA
ncbi:hypothetical protein HZH68_015696 [Vespula germanica]|uniref:Uncharacterized protein n=1 Tax=Vespula germanica TaxID=30212 RepID=A0A834J4L2_VESGE|nr:hypothetical protein HZH68_015696 [Vespula germanica]